MQDRLRMEAFMPFRLLRVAESVDHGWLPYARNTLRALRQGNRS